MSHIVIDARQSGTTSGRYHDKLVEHLHKMPSEHQFTVLTKSHRLDYLKQIAPRFTIQRCDVKEFTFAEQIILKRQIEKLQPDLVHFPMVQQPVFYKGLVVTTMNDLTTLKFLNPAKNRYILGFKQLVYRWVNKRVARKSAHLITYTDYVRNELVELAGVPREKFTTTHLAADPISDPAELIPELANRQFILYVGKPFPHKNLQRLIEAFVKLQATHPELVLVLAGKLDAVYQKHVDQVRASGIKNVVFTDFVSEGQLRWLYANTAAYVFPSLSEGFGLPGLEAMLEGAPVVASSATCLPEVYQDGARYFDPLDIEDMAAKIGEVLDDQKLVSELKKKGSIVAKQYSWQQTAKQTLAVYDQVLKIR